MVATNTAQAEALITDTVEVQKSFLDDLIEQTRQKDQGLQQFAIVPKGIEEAERYAKYIIRSKWAPKDWTEADVFIAVQYGLELGIHPLQAIQGIAVINGRPCIYGDLLLAVVLKSGLVEEWYERPAKEALDKGEGYFRIKRKGNPHPIEVYFTKAQAVEAKLWGKVGHNGAPTPWVLYPGRMLQMRARSWALRDGFADVLKGMAVMEEARDIEVEAPTVAKMLKEPQRKSEQPKPAEPAKDPNYADAATKLQEKKDEAQKLVESAPAAPAPSNPPVAATGTTEIKVLKVEVVPYKDAKTGTDKKFYKITAEGGVGYATWSDTEASVATDSIGKGLVSVNWKKVPGKDNLQIKALSPVIPQPKDSEIPEEPGMNG